MVSRYSFLTDTYATEMEKVLYETEGRIARIQPTGTMVLWLAILLGAALAVSLLDVR